MYYYCNRNKSKYSLIITFVLQFKKFAKQHFINSTATNSFSTDSLLNPLINKVQLIDKLVCIHYIYINIKVLLY